jgi:predicted ArsR family transcriptional regulator
MLNSFGSRQQEILRVLLRAQDGLTIEEILERVPVTRTAVAQHLNVFERDGYLEHGTLASTGGRPSRIFKLSPRGIDLFPKQYSWFSALLLEGLAGQMGDEGLARFLEGLAGKIAAELEPRLQGLTPAKRMEAIVSILNDLAFDAELAHRRGSKEPILQASNCIYHHLAAKHPEVCAFDRALLAKLTGKKVTQTECIVRGGAVCKFQFGKSIERSKS